MVNCFELLSGHDANKGNLEAIWTVNKVKYTYLLNRALVMSNLYSYLKNALRNFKENLFFKITPDQMELINNTHLFDNMPNSYYQALLNSIAIRHYDADQIIFKEGSVGNGLYIVFEGAVRVFTHNKSGKKIPLARLERGDYFGEQALLGHANKSRNASIEAIGQTKLLRIKPRFIRDLLESELFQTNQLKIEKQQLIHKLTSITAFESIKAMLVKKIENVVTYQNDDIIFGKDDFSDAAYIILQGRVTIDIPQEENNFTVNLSEGDIFGDLGILQNTPRTGNAKALGVTKLLRMRASEFRDLCANNPEFNKFITLLNHTYLLPKRGSATQVFGSIKGESAITTTYKLGSGQLVEAVLSTDNVFRMQVLNSSYNHSQQFVYSNPKVYVAIMVADNYIQNIYCVGNWRYLNNACSYVLDKHLITHSMLMDFSKRGYFKPIPNEPVQMICSCLGIPASKIDDLVESGTNNLETICEKTGAGTVCGNCRFKILRILGHATWIPAQLKKQVSHNEFVTSYVIQPIDDKFNPYLPGQHLILQVKVQDYWIERAYTITGQISENQYIVTVKHKKDGLLSAWLREQTDAISIYTSQPLGDFVLSKNDPANYLFFAVGLGIAPFIAFLDYLKEKAPQGSFHLVYFVCNKEEVLFMDELNNYKKVLPNFKLTLWDKAALDDFNITTLSHLTTEQNNPTIYICGSEGFEVKICQALKEINYDKNKIHIEKFTYSTPKQAQHSV